MYITTITMTPCTSSIASQTFNLQASSMAELPSDVIFDIFSRIPVKSLARFRCVSKPWCKLIDDPHLAIMHLERAVEEPIAIVSRQHPTHPNTLLTLSLYTVETKEDSTTLELKKEPVFEFECRPSFWRSSEAVVRGYCNGLMYFSQDPGDVVITRLVVTNPLRKERYVLPPIHRWSGSREFSTPQSCGLGFDASTNTFKMVCVLRIMQVPIDDMEPAKETWCTLVHVLGTDSWREIPLVPPYPRLTDGLFAHGCLHWLSCRDDYLGTKVISFEVKTEEFRLIDPPEKLSTFRWINYYHLIYMHGDVGFVYYYVDDRIVVWLLKGEEWVLYCRIHRKPPLPINVTILVLGRWNNDGDILMRTHYTEVQRFFIYVVKTDVLREVRLVGREDGSEVDIRIYLRSLVSIRSVTQLNENIRREEGSSALKRKIKTLRITDKVTFPNQMSK